MSARYAIFFVPEDSSDLATFGCSVLGRRADGCAIATPESDHPDRQPLVEKAAHYGFHATLKAPFELQGSGDLQALTTSLAEFSSSCNRIELTTLAPSKLGNFCALILSSKEVNAAVSSLAAACVQEFDLFRAPLQSSDIDRRNPAFLSESQQRNLHEFGYPFVLDDFRFHMTLSSAAIEASSYLDWLKAYYSEAVTGTPVLDRISLCWQADRSQPFTRLREWPLT